MMTLKHILGTAALLLGGVSLSFAQSTAFTYQGWLNTNGVPYTGNAEFQPTLWSASGGGSQIAVNAPAQIIVGVTNGLFVLPLNFGGNFPGAARWLQLEVRTSVEPFTLLQPRQPCTPTPYAITAGGVSGTVPAAQLGGTLNSANLSGTYGNALTFGNAANTYNGSGAGLVGLNASNLASGTVPAARLPATVANTSEVWLLGGNAGTTAGSQFAGTTDNQAFELRVNNQRALRLEPTGYPDTVNVIGGSAGNFVAPGVMGATISGGGSGNFGGGPSTNSVASHFATIGGGRRNKVLSGSAVTTISGGDLNTIQTDSPAATIGGGSENTIQANSDYAIIGGGWENTIERDCWYATISGGRENTIQPSASGATISGGWNNLIQTNARFSTTGGGHLNTIQTNASYATIGGGIGNKIQKDAAGATIPGGGHNSAALYAFAAGYRAKANHPGAFVWADHTEADFSSTGNNQFLIRAGGGVGINKNNPATALDVDGTITADGLLSYGASGNNLMFQKTGSLSAANVQFVFSQRPNGNELWLYGYDGTNYRNLQGWNHANNTVRFPANGNTLYIDQANARVGIGRTPAANALEVNGTASKSAAGSWVANSDARIKQDITSVTDALDTLDKVRLVSFRYTEDYRKQHPSVEDRRYLNVVAQEFAQVFPDDVQSSGEKLADGQAILQVDTYPLTIYAAAAVQELNRKLETQLQAKDAELQALKASVAELQTAVRRLTLTSP